jgi:hypothetical protein
MDRHNTRTQISRAFDHALNLLLRINAPRFSRMFPTWESDAAEIRRYSDFRIHIDLGGLYLYYDVDDPDNEFSRLIIAIYGVHPEWNICIDDEFLKIQFPATPQALKKYVFENFIDLEGITVKEIAFVTFETDSVQVVYSPKRFQNTARTWTSANQLPMIDRANNLNDRKPLGYPVDDSTTFVGPDWTPLQYQPRDHSNYIILESEVDGSGHAPRAYHQSALAQASTTSVNPFTRDLLQLPNMTRLYSRPVEAQNNIEPRRRSSSDDMLANWAV